MPQCPIMPFSSHVVVAGFASIGRNTFIGINSTISDFVNIGADNFIGAACVITKDTQAGEVYRQVPTPKSTVGSLRFCKVGSDEMDKAGSSL